MKDRELDNLLSQLGKEQVTPPEELVSATKKRIHRQFMFNLILSASLISQLLWIIPAIWLFMTPALSVTVKVVIYYSLSSVAGLVLTLIYFSRDKSEKFFTNLAEMTRF
jgi:hypothetical protein